MVKNFSTKKKKGWDMTPPISVFAWNIQSLWFLLHVTFGQNKDPEEGEMVNLVSTQIL